MDISRFNSAYLIAPSVSTPPLPAVKEEQNQPPIELSLTGDYAVFSGDGTGLIMPRSEATDRMQAVLDRLDATSARYLISSGLIENESFLSFTERMSDADLTNFAHTTKALRTPSDQLPIKGPYSGISPIKALFESLQAMSGDTLSRVLEKTAELSAPVPEYERKLFFHIYDIKGHFPQGSAAATPLHNFVKAIANIDSDGMNEQANSLLDHLLSYGEGLENTLLQIASADAKSAVNIMAQMQDYTADTQDQVFSYLAELASSVRPNRFYYLEGDDPGKGVYGLGVLAGTREYVADIMGTFSSLMANYQLTDLHITDMIADLSVLDKESQHAYLEITKVGLDTFLREEGNQKQLSIPNQALAVIDNLRNDRSARILVGESGFGKQHKSIDGQIMYEPKNKVTSKQDEAQVIEVLVTNAWMNRDPVNSGHLVNALSSLDAEQRDKLIDELSAFNDRHLYHPSFEEQEGYQSLQERLDVISNTDDLPALLAAEDKLPNDSVENFWAAANFLEKASNTFVEMINRSNAEGAQVLVGLIVALDESIENEEMTYEQAIEQAHAILSIKNWEKVNW